MPAVLYENHNQVAEYDRGPLSTHLRQVQKPQACRRPAAMLGTAANPARIKPCRSPAGPSRPTRGPTSPTSPARSTRRPPPGGPHPPRGGRRGNTAVTGNPPAIQARLPPRPDARGVGPRGRARAGGWAAPPPPPHAARSRPVRRSSLLPPFRPPGAAAAKRSGGGGERRRSAEGRRRRFFEAGPGKRGGSRRYGRSPEATAGVWVIRPHAV